jgi:Uncharacterized conserved protein
MIKKLKYLLLALLLAFSGLYSANYEQKVNKTFTLPESGTLELSNINGEINISTTKGGSVEIKAIKKSDYKGEIENVDVIFDLNGDKLQVKVKHKERNTRAKVEFTVSVPEKLAAAYFKSVNGRIDCQGKFAELKLKTVNGKVGFAGEFVSATFKTVNGAIEVSQEPLLGGDLAAETVNGAIEIELNRKSAFAIEGRTINGSIRNDFGVKVDRHLVGSSMDGQVNDGRFKVRVETVNGSIEISKI